MKESNMKVICKTPFPEITVAGFANPKRPSGGWMKGDAVEVNDDNRNVICQLLRTDEWEEIPENKEPKYKKPRLEE
jgi:hypothetical protein